jgi:predicted glycogen debranching enzyme
MISLEGLTMITGRFTEAGWILKTFAQYVNHGLIPNFFPEGNREALYHTADATLWFFHALQRYLDYTKDRSIIHLLLDRLINIIDCHIEGTLFGIKADPADSLLSQGQDGYQLTWMDAKVGDWVVTPRRGKAVEINALWFNAVKLLYNWVSQERGGAAAAYLADLADKITISFNKRFWYDKGQYLLDVVDGPQGDEISCRPNQLLAISLDNPVLDRNRWEPVVHTVSEKLLTPFGLRSLSLDHPDYKSMYSGDLRSRDAAYHQGTVWTWLIGPFIDAWLRVFPHDLKTAQNWLRGFDQHLNDACVGSISEIFDAQKPHTPRGCISQAWSVAEVLRCLVKTNPESSGFL